VFKNGFWVEPKFDGERLQIHKDGDDIRCYSRYFFSSLLLSSLELSDTNVYEPYLRALSRYIPPLPYSGWPTFLKVTC